MQRQNLLNIITDDPVTHLRDDKFAEKINDLNLNQEELYDFYEAITKRVVALELPPNEKEKLYLIIIKNNLHSFRHIPEPERSRALYLDAVRQTPEAMEIIPVEMLDYDMYYTCVSNQKINMRKVMTISDIPVEMRDFKMCAAIVKLHGLTIEPIINYQETSKLSRQEFIKLYDLAIETTPEAIKFIPKMDYSLKDNEIKMV